MTEGARPSMYETVRDHENDLKEHRERITTLEDITMALKESDRQHDERLNKLEDNAVKLENTIMVENRETRNTMKEQTEKLFGIVEKAMGYQSSEAEYRHEQKMAKINTWANVFLKIIGGLTAVGGIGYLIIQHFLNQVGGN
ncbi:hypothetical protein ACIQYS_09855 [Psychrobacillus sp. NPDC096426]|uniref:hypothetical protein n=1 Tax=Psychrobacillus sp. NPDC096426 TaxID=3364491 RepID=UPI0037FCBD87